MNLRSKFKGLKKNKENTKKLMIELMAISSIDFTVEHMAHKLYKYGFTTRESDCFRFMNELCVEQKLIYNGCKPIKLDGFIIGCDHIFGLIRR